MGNNFRNLQICELFVGLVLDIVSGGHFFRVSGNVIDSRLKEKDQCHYHNLAVSLFFIA